MIDMHIHTVHSDGIYTAVDILRNAEKIGLSKISITDHDSVDVYEEILKNDLLKLYSGSLIPGTELKCHINNEVIELLVYDFNIDKMKEFIKNNYTTWENVNRQMTLEFEAILLKEGITYDKNIIVTHDFSKYNGIMELYKSVLEDVNNHAKLESNLYKSIPEFFRKCVCNKDSKFYVDLTKYYPSAQKIIHFSKDNGYKVFMPHVFLFNSGFEILEKLYNEYGLDGVECYHPSYNLEECNKLIDFCNKNNLLISAGSDYHGKGYSLGSPSEYIDIANIRLGDFKNILKRK